MSDDRPDRSAPSTQELEAVVSRVVAEGISPLHEQVARLGRAVAILGDRVRPRTDVDLAERLDEVRQAMSAAVEQGVVWIESTVTTDSSRLLDQVAALEVALVAGADVLRAQCDDARTTMVAEVGARQAQVEDLSRTLSMTIDAVERRMETARAADLALLLDRIEQLDVRSAAASRRSEDQTVALLAAVDERLQSVLAAGANAGGADVTGLVQATARIEALASGNVEEVRGVQSRVASMLDALAERTEGALDRSRARTAEGQVALSARFEGLRVDVLAAVQATSDRLEAAMKEGMNLLCDAGGQESAGLLAAVTRSAQQAGEGLAEVRAMLVAGGSGSKVRQVEDGRLIAAVTERLDAIRGAVESLSHDARLDMIVLEVAAGRRDQRSAIETVSGRIDEVGPLVASALLSEVERAARSASAAEEAVMALNPEALRATLASFGTQTAEGAKATTARLDRAVAAIAELIDEKMARIEQGQAGIRAQVVDTAKAGEVTLHHLRAVQAGLRETVQDGAHKAELAAVDMRALRDRLTPHLVALAEATSRRADADQAGFDAVLARIDQLLGPRIQLAQRVAQGHDAEPRSD